MEWIIKLKCKMGYHKLYSVGINLLNRDESISYCCECSSQFKIPNPTKDTTQ